MANLIACPSCQFRLSLGADFRGRRVKCPRCQRVIEVGAPEVVDAVPLAESTAPPEYHREPPRPALPPARSAPPREETEDHDDELRRRKNGERRKQRGGGGKPAWVWLLFAGGALMSLLLLGGTIALVMHLQIMPDLVEIGLGLAIMTPISVIVLIVSMFLSSALAGGIDFGPAHWAILKATGLLLVINLVTMIPFAGVWIALPIWVCGLMLLYDLDFWEARFLIIINWGLNTIIRLFILAFIISLIQQGKIDTPENEEDAKQAKAEAALMDALDKIEDLGGDIVDDDGDEVRGVSFNGKPLKDADLKVLGTVTTLRSLDLSHTQITDKGLVHLKGLKNLQFLGLQGTKVTDAGVKDLQQALPKTHILR